MADVDIITRASAGTLVFGLLPLVPITIVSALLTIAVSRLTGPARPGPATLARYFPGSDPIFLRARWPPSEPTHSRQV